MKKLLIIVLIVIAGCKKKEQPIVFKFWNDLKQPINVKLYATRQDYFTQTSPVESFRINAKDSFKIVKSTIEGKANYIDWYTDNFYHNNIYHGAHESGQAPPIFYNTNSWSNEYIPPYGSLARIVCLGGAGTQNTWKTLDGTSYITFYKDFKAVMSVGGSIENLRYYYSKDDSVTLSIDLVRMSDSLIIGSAKTYRETVWPMEKYSGVLYVNNYTMKK